MHGEELVQGDWKVLELSDKQEDRGWCELKIRARVWLCPGYR